MFGLNACGIFFLTFFFAKSTEKSLYTKNHSKRVLWPREVLFQIWKPSMQICHCHTQICAGRIKKRKKKKNQKFGRKHKTSRPTDGMPNKFSNTCKVHCENLYACCNTSTRTASWGIKFLGQVDHFFSNLNKLNILKWLYSLVNASSSSRSSQLHDLEGAAI